MAQTCSGNPAWPLPSHYYYQTGLVRPCLLPPALHGSSCSGSLYPRSTGKRVREYCQSRFFSTLDFYRSQKMLREGKVFTGICLFTRKRQVHQMYHGICHMVRYPPPFPSIPPHVTDIWWSSLVIWNLPPDSDTWWLLLETCSTGMLSCKYNFELIYFIHACRNESQNNDPVKCHCDFLFLSKPFASYIDRSTYSKMFRHIYFFEFIDSILS